MALADLRSKRLYVLADPVEDLGEAKFVAIPRTPDLIPPPRLAPPKICSQSIGAESSIHWIALPRGAIWPGAPFLALFARSGDV